MITANRFMYHKHRIKNLIILTFAIFIVALFRIIVKIDYNCSLNIESYTAVYSNSTEIREETTKNKSYPLWAPNFQFIINNRQLCKNKDIYSLIVVHSKVSNFLNRGNMREVLNRLKKIINIEVKMVFMVAQTIIPEVQTEINKEATRYGDIVQGSFVDNYKTMTYKHLSTIKWVIHFCSHVKYILKIDDDVFFNLSYIEKYILQLNASMDNQICCKTYVNTPVLRRGKNEVTIKEYPDKFYPDFCQGMAYITTPIVYKKLHFAALESEFLWLDDVFVTGILTKKTGIKLIDFSTLSRYYHSKIPHEKIEIEKFMFVSSAQDMMENWPFWMNQIEAENSRNTVQS